MKKYFGILLLGLTFGLSACSDDEGVLTGPTEEVTEERNPALESWAQDINANIAALRAIVEEGDYILSVKPKTENNKEVGFVVSFLNKGDVVILNGEKGATGGTPIVGVTREKDGLYYWTLNGALMKDVNDNPICTKNSTLVFSAGSQLTDAQVSYRDPKAIYWSTNSGGPWYKTFPPAGSTATNYIFDTIDASDDSFVKFTLTSGEVISIPRYVDFTLLYNGAPFEENELTLSLNAEAAFGYIGAGIKVSATIDGAKAEFTDKMLAIDTSKEGDFVYAITVTGKDKKELTYEVTVHVVMERLITGQLAAILNQAIAGLTTAEIEGKLVINVSKSLSVIESVTDLDLSNQNLASLAGLEYFTNVTKLNIANNRLPYVDAAILAAMPELETLICDSYGGGAVTRSVKFVSRSAKQATRAGEESVLDVSNNPKLKILSCSNNKLTALLFPKTEQTFLLESLNCAKNEITVLEVSVCTELKTLVCSENKLTELDLSNNPAMTELNCSDNNLTALDVSVNVNLKTLDCASNQITELNVSQNKQLENLACNDNQLTSIDVSANEKLDVANMTVGDQKAEDGSDVEILVDVNDQQMEAIIEIIQKDEEGNTNVTIGGTTPVDPETPVDPVDPEVPENPVDPTPPTPPTPPTKPGNTGGNDYTNGGRY